MTFITGFSWLALVERIGVQANRVWLYIKLRQQQYLLQRKAKAAQKAKEKQQKSEPILVVREKRAVREVGSTWLGPAQ